MAKPGYYSVRAGVKPGIYRTWAEAEPLVKSYPGAQYKKFNTEREAIAFLGDTPLGRKLSEAMAVSSFASTSTPTTSKVRSRDDDGDGSGSNAKKKFKPQESSSGREVYCDGSCLGNGKVGSTAGIGVYWVGRESKALAERLPGLLQTNNRAEMYAIARILEDDPTPHLPLVICTDSAYCIGAFQTWIPGWLRSNWKKSDGQPVLNKDLILYVLALIKSRLPLGSTSLSSNITFKKVKAHVAIQGNEEADRLAKLGAAISTPVLERDYAAATARLEKRLEAKGVEDVDVIDFMIDENDLLTESELRELEGSQDF